jgi:transcriptional regulator with XRE-family HTH domain
VKNIRLIQLRTSRHLTQKQLGEATGISKQQISRIENNQQLGSTKTLRKLAAYFCITIDYLLSPFDETA